MSELARIKAQQKLNSQATSIELPKAFSDKFSNLTKTKQQKHFQTYLKVVAEALIPKLPFLNDEQETHIATGHMFNACGSFQDEGVRYHVWKEFKDIYPFFSVIETGSNVKRGKNPYENNSKVKIYRRAVDMLLNERSPRVVFAELYGDLDLNNGTFEKLPIDMENLENFIGNTEYAISKEQDGPLKSKLQRSLYQAQLVYKVGEHTEAVTLTAYLPMIPKPSIYGRTYYSGLNVQNVTKQVRSAMIGEHYQYDMNAAVYAVKLALLNDINGGENEVIGTKTGTYTRQYIDEKNAIRSRLASECFDGLGYGKDATLKYVKNALTAIGFGAKTDAGFWMDEGKAKGTAIAEIIKNKGAREKFLNDQWVVNFINEQHSIEDEIIAAFKAVEGFEGVHAALKQANTDKGGNGRVTKAQLLAYVYQQQESSMMDDAVAILEANGIKVIARIHDAFIVRAKVPARIMDEVIMAWSRYSRHITLDCEEVRKWRPVEVKKAVEQHDALVALHQAHLRTEDRLARIYALKKTGGAA